eukprot:888392_1
MTMQLEVILPLVAYLVVVFGISVYAMRKRSTGTFLNEYFLGSRSMGGIVLAMTLTATYISASSFIGGPGAAYKYGLGWVLLAMIQLPAVWLSLGILGKKFAILARRYNAVTLNDMLFARYQSRLLVWLASLSLLANEWLASALESQPVATVSGESWYFFGHCTEVTALPGAPAQWAAIFARFGAKLENVSVGCCGMAGTYGHEAKNHENSLGIYELSWHQAMQRLPRNRCL